MAEEWNSHRREGWKTCREGITLERIERPTQKGVKEYQRKSIREEEGERSEDSEWKETYIERRGVAQTEEIWRRTKKVVIEPQKKGNKNTSWNKVATGNVESWTTEYGEWVNEDRSNRSASRKSNKCLQFEDVKDLQMRKIWRSHRRGWRPGNTGERIIKRS